MTRKKIVQRAILGSGSLFALAAVSLFGGGMFAPLVARVQAATSTEPVITAISASPTDTSATITWSTDQPSNSQVGYGTTIPYSTFSSLDNNNTVSHSVVLTGLVPGTLYHYEVLSQNASTSLSTSSDQTFMTTTSTSTATSSLPVISSVLVHASDTSATITWNTDVAATSQVSYGTTTPSAVVSVLNSTPTTSHSVVLTGLAPDTAYQFKVLSGTSAGTTSSLAQTFMTMMSGSGPEPVISNVVASPTDTSATITWKTDEGATTAVKYGLSSSYTASIPQDNGSVMNHTATITGLAPQTTYHFEVLSTDGSGNMASSADQTFTTSGSSTTTTPDITALQNEIAVLESELSALKAELATLLGGGGGSVGSTTPATIDQNGGTFTAGGGIDFGGRNFGHEETVLVTMGGQFVTTAHADGGGNFSTGSLTLPSMPGTYSYLFVGQKSGISVNATITVK